MCIDKNENFYYFFYLNAWFSSLTRTIISRVKFHNIQEMVWNYCVDQSNTDCSVRRITMIFLFNSNSFNNSLIILCSDIFSCFLCVRVHLIFIFFLFQYSSNNVHKEFISKKLLHLHASDRTTLCVRGEWSMKLIIKYSRSEKEHINSLDYRLVSYCYHYSRWISLCQWLIFRFHSSQSDCRALLSRVMVTVAVVEVYSGLWLEDLRILTLDIWVRNPNKLIDSLRCDPIELFELLLSVNASLGVARSASKL